MKFASYLMLIGAASAMEIEQMIEKRDQIQNQLFDIQNAIDMKEREMDALVLADDATPAADPPASDDSATPAADAPAADSAPASDDSATPAADAPASDDS